MPKILPDRWRHESIREFRVSARARYEDALALAAAGRRTGAIYLWGYCAEMLLKSAYFALRGKLEENPIVPQDISDAIKRAKAVFSIAWSGPGQGHNVRAWSELLEVEHSYLGRPYPATFRRRVQRRAALIGQLWSVTLRYHGNLAYLHEVTQVQEAAEWLLVNANEL